MESFKSISAIDSALTNIDDALTKMATDIESIRTVKDEFDTAWKSAEATVVQNKITELTTNLEALQKGVSNIKIKVNNAKSLAVAADTTVFGNGGGAPSPSLNSGPNSNVSYTKE